MYWEFVTLLFPTPSWLRQEQKPWRYCCNAWVAIFLAVCLCVTLECAASNHASSSHISQAKKKLRRNWDQQAFIVLHVAYLSTVAVITRSHYLCFHVNLIKGMFHSGSSFFHYNEKAVPTLLGRSMSLMFIFACFLLFVTGGSLHHLVSWMGLTSLSN